MDNTTIPSQKLTLLIHGHSSYKDKEYNPRNEWKSIDTKQHPKRNWWRLGSGCRNSRQRRECPLPKEWEIARYLKGNILRQHHEIGTCCLHAWQKYPSIFYIHRKSIPLPKFIIYIQLCVPYRNYFAQGQKKSYSYDAKTQKRWHSQPDQEKEILRLLTRRCTFRCQHYSRNVCSQPQVDNWWITCTQDPFLLFVATETDWCQNFDFSVRWCKCEHGEEGGSWDIIGGTGNILSGEGTWT